jgi:phosphoglycolate phosphatase-like HAD superfamily hydrolase
VSSNRNAQATAATTIRSGVSHVIFDFDGTLSWLRNGWPDVMVELFAEFLPHEHRSSKAFRKHLRREILSLNGKPSIHQMRRFHEIAPEFKAAPPEPPLLMELYLARLDTVLRRRVDSLIRRETSPESFVIAGAFMLLDELRLRGLRLVILSGTAEPDVRREAELLQLKPYFGEHIYGSTPGMDFSKKEVIGRIMREEGIEGAHLLSFGDGPVEIEFTKAVGGRAVGVASDENANGSGIIDEDKREHLLLAGADAVIPDYRNTSWILETFLRETRPLS